MELRHEFFPLFKMWEIAHGKQMGYRLTNALRMCDKKNRAESMGVRWPVSGLKGKPVRFRHGPAAVYGDETPQRATVP